MDKVQIEDCKSIGNLDFVQWEEFRDAKILITGATGLIGSNLVNALAYNNVEKELGIELTLPVRDVEAAERLFEGLDVEIIPYRLGMSFQFEKSVDYIVHLASPTSSKFFIDKPADTVFENVGGTNSILEWSVKHPIKKLIALSTMEVYGFPRKGHKVKESELGAFETMNARNSYPIAKIATEALCNGYYVQYGVPIVVLRATQTFGPGVKYDDSRVFAQFMRCVIEKKDIILKSSGDTERSYLYTADAVTAILVGLIEAENGQAYTIANPSTYCSIKEMAQMVANEVGNGKIGVIFDLVENVEELGYASTLFMDLDISKMTSLGWYPRVGLVDMYKRMIKSVNG